MADKGPLPVYSRRLREAREVHGISQRSLGIEAGLDEFATKRVYTSPTCRPCNALQRSSSYRWLTSMLKTTNSRS